MLRRAVRFAFLRTFVFSLALSLMACGAATSGHGSQVEDATVPDTATAPDSASPDASGADVGAEDSMAAPTDGAATDAGDASSPIDAGDAATDAEDDVSTGGEAGADAGDGASDATPPSEAGVDSSAIDAAEAGTVFSISPSNLTVLVVVAGQSSPTVTFTATLNGFPVSAAWAVDRGDIANIPLPPSSTGIFTPTGTTGGLATVTAGFNGMTASAQVFVELFAQQNGVNPNVPSEVLQTATSVGQLTAGGGVGGVGGEGLGGPVTDNTTLGALQNPTSNGQALNLTFLYPYDGTVWPRGMLAPLLMWSWMPGNADAVQISLATASGSFSWTGTFAPPSILMQTGGDFIRQPIPQDIWAMATSSAGGTTMGGQPDNLTVSLTVASGGVGYGPISETWPVAPGLLDGIIYYNSYGTQLALNYTGAVGGNGQFGGAVLSIHVGDTSPKLVAGSNGGTAQCRTCHSVAAGGSALVVQHGDNYSDTSAYALNVNSSVEEVLPVGSGTNAWFSAVYPDGSLALTEFDELLPLPNDSTQPFAHGLSNVSTDIGTPMFSPDGTLVGFNPMTGPGVTTPTQQMVVMNFDVTTSTFSNPVVVVDDTGKPAQTRPGWPAFLPGNGSLVFHHQSVAGYDGNGSGSLYTRGGSKAQIAWTSTTDSQHVTPLDALNGIGPGGTSYLPVLSPPIDMTCTADGNQVGNINPDHGDDVDVNYEPTVNPVAAGGYVWVVFTSRRMYGNEAVIPPFCSDPRGVNLIKDITPKKLWVAAIDLNAAPSTDASHPAFYLPAQELLAGNSRGFWVLDPCRSDGSACQSGDQCCNGYCEAEGDGGALICANTPPNNACAGLNDRCVTTGDCCAPNHCIGGFCTVAGQ